MNQFFTSASGLDARGVGPHIMLRTAPLLLAAIIAEIWFAKIVEIPFLNNPVATATGWIWLTVGVALFVSSIVQFSRNFPKGELLRTGLFACSRNPIYSCWILFILPSFWLIFNNWLFLISAAIMCIATIILVKEEEIQLLKVFGKQYTEYRTQVGCIVRFLGKNRT